MSKDNTGLDSAIVKTIQVNDNANTFVTPPAPAYDPGSHPRDPGWPALEARVADLDANGRANY